MISHVSLETQKSLRRLRPLAAAAAVALCLGIPPSPNLQAAVQITTLDNTPANSASIEGGINALGFVFTTDSQQYYLDNAIISLGRVEGAPMSYEIAIYAFSGGVPSGPALGTLSLGSTVVFPNLQNTTLTPDSTILLDADTSYVLTFTMPGPQNPMGEGYQWGYTSDPSYGPPGTLWTTPGSVLFSPNAGTSWSTIPGIILMTEINATAVPEPSTFLLLGGAIGAGLLFRRRNRV